MRRLTIVRVLAVALVALGSSAPQPAAAAHHEPVIQVVTVEVEPGKLEKYRGEVKKLMGVMERLGSSGRIRMWQATAAGPDAGTVLVGIEYPNAAAWASDAPKVGNDAEWQKILSGLDGLRTVVSNAVWRDVSPAPASSDGSGSGALLAITGVQVNPGKMDAYLKRIAGASSIAERLEMSGGEARTWHAILAGPNTGAVAVGVEYADLATYVADQGKLAADAEWQKMLSGLDGMRTITGRWIYQEITP